MSKKNYFKRFTNFTRYFLVGLFVAVCSATANKTSAYSMWDLWQNYRFCNGSTYPITYEFYVNPSYQNQYYNTGNGYIGAVYDSSLNLDYASPLVYSRNSWYHYKNLGGGSMSCSYVSYPLVGIDTNNQNGLIFKYFVDGDTPTMENFVVESRAGFQHTFGDGYSCVMDQVYFNVGSIIFKCSDSDRTYQILAGGYTLYNHILYVDIVNSSNNVWWISWAENKAWSITVSQAVRSQIVYGGLDINQSFLENLFNSGYVSYSISEGGNNIFPTCGLASCTPQSDDGSPGYVYSRDLEQVAPDFGASINPDSNSGTGVVIPGSISQKKSLEEYNSCIDRYIGVSDISKAMYSCRSDYDNGRVTREQFLSMQNYVLDLSSNTAYTGETVTDSCFLMVDMALNQFDVHSGTYNIDINLAFRGSTSLNGLDLTYMCGSRPEVQPTSNPSNWWQDILDSLGVGRDSTGSGTVIDSVFDGLKDLVSSPIDTYVINPITSEYNSGYNVLNSSSCVVNNSSFAYGDYILYFGVVLIFIVLFGLFF